ncbi:hypothetical protein FPE01S_02_08740 [Flavihumibacter petaseus NBRC 106054]|uniref:Lin1244/Lin1753-like N-terminal domain-containing protein n=2 Tax=Flavihumibacter TaxID=1004301 RepID=A0A0E9N1W4_9BACT|nr:hypothetical protein FPE01S_02_08740 [Flavihumibacter petaseus NBRC 106054]
MHVADDYGRYDARPSVLRVALYPLKIEKVSESDVVKWMTECVNAGLVRQYTVDEKNYLLIERFGQRMRTKKSRYPDPHGVMEESAADGGEVQQHAATGSNKLQNVGREVEGKRSRREEKVADKPPMLKGKSLEDREQEFYVELASYVQTYGKEMIRKFYDYWREPNKSRSKMRWEQERTWELKLRLIKWEERDASFNRGKSERPVDGLTINEKIKAASKAN